MPLEKNKKISLIHKGHISEQKITLKYISREVPQSIRLSGSLTVEAALVFPLFLFALVGVLFFFRILQVTQVTYGALAVTGSRLSLETEEISMTKAVGYFQKELLGENCSCIVGDRVGIGWDETTLEGEYVDLQIQYYCKLPVQLFHIKYIPVKQRVQMKKWTGYHKGIQDENQETWVYITLNGSVYHMTRECTHLRLSIQTMGKPEAKKKGYTACELCGKEAEWCPYYYVTEEGKKYHKRLNCSGLKRTIYMIRRSEVGSRAACSRCGT